MQTPREAQRRKLKTKEKYDHEFIGDKYPTLGRAEEVIRGSSCLYNSSRMQVTKCPLSGYEDTKIES